MLSVNNLIGFGSISDLSSISIDQYFNYVTMLLQGNGTNGAQNNTFLDDSPNNFTITRNGNTTQGSFGPYGNRWSNYFDGTGDFLSFTGITLNGDFCLEAWYYRTGNPANGYSVIFGGSALTGDNNNQFVVYNNGSVSIALSSTVVVTAAGTAAVANAWNHIAFVRKGSSLAIFVNGVRQATGTSSINTSICSRIGDIAGTAGYLPIGYISNARIVVGSSVYDPSLTTLTVPTAPLTAITNTSLLTCQSNRFIDNSSNNFTITRNGDVSVRPFNPFLPSAAYSASVNGGSGYFDGTGDYLKSPSNAAFAFGTGDFTMEAWIYPTSSVTTTQGVVSTRIDASGSTSQSFFGIDSGQALYYAGSLIQGGAVTLNQWTHIACSRQSNTIRVFVNGVQTATGTDTANKTTTFGYVGAGGGDNSQLFTGYITDARFVKGTAVYTANFTPPTSPLTAITNTSLLLNFTNAGIIDSAADNVLETVGNAQISTSVRKYGTGSINFNGTSDYLIGPNNPELILTGDFTIEMWVRGSATRGIYPLMLGRNAAYTAVNNVYHCYRHQNLPNVFALYRNPSSPLLSGSTTLTDGVWYHYAVTRSGSTVRMFVDGVLQTNTLTDSSTWNYSLPVIGSNPSDGGATVAQLAFGGNIDDLRITNGVARYTSNFTPPDTEFPRQ